MATKRVFPKARIIFNYSVSRSIFASVSNIKHPFLQEDLDAIKQELDSIIAKDIPIKRSSITKEEATSYYDEIGYKDKAKTLKYRKESTVHVYECDTYRNYMFGYMLPSTGYIKSYKLRKRDKFLILRMRRFSRMPYVRPIAGEILQLLAILTK